MSKHQPVTVLGAGGWIGSSLVKRLKQQGRTVIGVERPELLDWLTSDDDPGTVIFAIGLTADFRERPHETVHAHVGLVSDVLMRRELKTFLYLSSTRVYARSSSTNESAELPCLSQDPSDLYNLSKLLGEALVLQDSRPGLKVVRLSNVVGPGQPQCTFIGSLIQAAGTNNQVTIQQAPSTEKDYVALADVVELLPAIAERGQERLYNLGSGRNTTHGEVAAWLEQQGTVVRFSNEASPGPSFPTLSIKRLLAEFPAPQKGLTMPLG